MLVLRSVVFNLLFYFNLLAHVIAAIPTYALPRRAFMAIAKSWGADHQLAARRDH